VGDGTFDDSDTPIAVLGGHSFTALSAEGSHTCALTTAGAAYCWGGNNAGQLGDGTGGGSAFSDFPVAVLGGHTFAVISAGQGHTCGVTATGDAFCWGDNVSGQLGDGNLGMDSHIPIGVLGGHAFEAINGGGLHTCGVATTGDPFCWGENFSGQLGDGNAPTSSDIPVAVVSP
jgi:hypothetical protein